ALHADEVLDGSGDADGEIELRCDGLSRRTDLAFDGEPAVVADGARCGDLCAEGGGEILNEGEIAFFADAATDGYDHGGGAEVYSLSGAAEGLAGLGADLRGFDGWIEGRDFGGAGLRFFCTECAGLDRNERGAAGGFVRSAETALHERADEDGTVADLRHVAD